MGRDGSPQGGSVASNDFGSKDPYHIDYIMFAGESRAKWYVLSDLSAELGYLYDRAVGAEKERDRLNKAFREAGSKSQ